MKQIPLTQNKFAIIDDEDYDFLMQWKWMYNAKGPAVRSKHLYGSHDNAKRKMYYMHREIMKAKDNEEVDHKNHDPLDNRKINLRICNRSQNLYNMRMNRKNTSGYKGVSWNKRRKRWMAQISIMNRTCVIGAFSAKSQAARAYNAMARKLRGDFAWTNKV